MVRTARVKALTLRILVTVEIIKEVNFIIYLEKNVFSRDS